MEGIFQLGKSQWILYKMGNYEKILENSGNFRQMLFVIFSDIWMNCVLFAKEDQILS